ncbi:PLP-dependent aminotransferase family protein [Sinorhizobium meliloti]|uniref:aminotransferase-like domain-containing protein n=1 Tax=Rhizobium meliloti TaxID=382 RepID=UPI000FE06379|nr:PLP-dependent aminotransferase family protein [Sinorhizobium meliloti]RVK85230.1 PLP-dependent aminotransferase family protein [Sinorhizobium meliloti]
MTTAAAKQPTAHGLISLIRSTPPTPEWLGDAVKTALIEIANAQDRNVLLRYHKFQGTADDRTIAAKWIGEAFQAPVDPDRILVTNGTQNALWLILLTQIGTGNTVLVEDLSYYAFRQLARLAGIRIESVAMDDQGAVPEDFERQCRLLSPKALYLQPTLHNPTSIIMSRQRRQDLVDVARKHGVSIIEDDVYGSLPDQAPSPFAELAPELTWYATSPAKTVAPGIKIGYLVAPSPLAAKHTFDLVNIVSTWHAAPISNALSRIWIENGITSKIRDAIRSEIRERQTIAATILEGMAYQTNPSSVYLWLKLPDVIPQQKFISALAEKDVILRPGEMFFTDPAQVTNHVRIVLGSPESRAALAHGLTIIAGLIESHLSHGN